jgi:cell cycle arrest protein BUB2
MSPASSDTAKSFNKILSQPKYASKGRSSSDVSEAVKKLRRLILVDGIPSDAVGHYSRIQVSKV